MDIDQNGKDPVIRTVVIGVPYLVMAAVLGFIGWPAAAWVDGAAWPVLTDAKISNVRFIGTKQLCWAASWVKTRMAAPQTVHYTVQYGEAGAPIPAVVTRNGSPVQGVDRALGAASADFCLDLPAELPIGVPIFVNCRIVYEMPHGLWTIRQEFPQVRAN